MSENQHDEDQTQSFVPLTKGTEIGHYKIISKIGAGGMGEVYLGEDTKLKRKVALKFLPHHYSSDRDLRERFTREAQAAAKLDHPNIVPVYEVGEYGERPFFAMAHIEGRSLREVIKDGKLGIDDAVNLTMQICEGLHKAHEAGVVHRDIKPGNIIIDKDGRARLVDFGLAMVSGEAKLTKTGSTLGTVGYMSPEQIEGKTCDRRSDLFSVGVILYEMLTGRRPFEGDNDAAIVKAITDSTPEPVARFKSGVTDEIQRIIDKALAKDASIRFQTAGDTLADLKRLQIESTSARKSKLSLWVSILVVIVIGAFFGYTQFIKEQLGPSGSKRLVVLPFSNLGSEDQEYFASGLTDEIISRLASISDLSVVSRMSAANMKKAGEDIQSIGERLGVEYVLDASARYQLGSDGNRRVRLITQLVNVSDDRIVWSQTYDTVMTDIFAVQGNIAEQVASHMEVVLQGSEKAAIWAKWTNSEEAYDYYLRGIEEAGQQERYFENTLRTGINLLQKAIALDTTFALAYAHISKYYSRLYLFGFARSDSIKALAYEAAENAARLSDNNWLKNDAFGDYYYRCFKDYRKALEYYDKAYMDHENDAEYLNTTHHVLRRMGEWDEAYQRMKRAIELDPKWPIYKYELAKDCFSMRRYEEAEQLYLEYLELQPNLERAYLDLFNLYCLWQGDIEKAQSVIKKSEGFIDSSFWHELIVWAGSAEGNYDELLNSITVPPYDSASYYLNRSIVYFSMGKRDKMQACSDSISKFVNQWLEKYPNNPDVNYYAAVREAGWGNREQALVYANKMRELSPISRDAYNGYQNALRHADIYLLLGDIEPQIALIDTLLSIPGEFGLGWLLVDKSMQHTVRHSKFKEIMDKHADSIQWELYRKQIIKP
jgi:serine/threonine protein kinase/Tfp pilus assembly protein PilF